MSDEPDSIVLDILRALQEGQARTEKGQEKTRDHLAAVNLRLVAVETHMSGFMSSTRYSEGEVDMLRGRTEAQEEATMPPHN